MSVSIMHVYIAKGLGLGRGMLEQIMKPPMAMKARFVVIPSNLKPIHCKNKDTLTQILCYIRCVVQALCDVFYYRLKVETCVPTSNL